MSMMLFLDVTGDNMWISHYAPESKYQSMDWKHPILPGKKKFRTQPSVGKSNVDNFWDAQGQILEHFQERDTTVNSVHYGEIFRDQLKPAIQTRRRGLVENCRSDAQQCPSAHCCPQCWKPSPTEL
jgi:hypothetical protein